MTWQSNCHVIILFFIFVFIFVFIFLVRVVIVLLFFLDVENFDLDLFNASVFDLKNGKSYVFKHNLAVLALLREISELTYNVTGNRIIIALRQILADYLVKLIDIR